MPFGFFFLCEYILSFKFVDVTTGTSGIIADYGRL